ncbi:MAG: alpha/beta hydrolase [Gammaproteobacteria bacterium]|nr:alpha/beta hydrolase [Gammaproteobacteria bacterium]
MTIRKSPVSLFGTAMLAAVTFTAHSQDLSLDDHGTLTVRQLTVPLPEMLSPGGREVLMRTRPTEGPGAPVPLPSDIEDIVELRRVYNENLKPNVDHMREVFPVDIEETTIDGISAAIITPKGGVPERNRNRLILNGPGGGFRTGVRGNGLLISIPVAATLGVKVVSILYRQGPEYRFPAASEDLLKVWRHFTQSYPAQNIGMVGCSAGGSLVSQTTAMLVEAGEATPGALGVYCAGLGVTPTGDAAVMSTLAITNVAAGVSTSSAARPSVNYYTGVDTNRFIAAPTLDVAKLAKFPPTIFFTATRDMAMSASAFSHRKLLQAGVESDLLIFEGLYHGFMTNPDFPEAQEGYRLTAAFFDQHLGR